MKRYAIKGKKKWLFGKPTKWWGFVNALSLSGAQRQAVKIAKDNNLMGNYKVELVTNPAKYLK